jgi:hypothetical protein
VVDIAIFYRNNQNRTYVTYILEPLSAYPQIKPLFLAFKKLCETFGLHDHLNGGLKTYTLFLMVFSIVKNLTTLNMGELFSQIALYYGFYYEYEFEYSEDDAGRVCGRTEEMELFPRAVFNFIDLLTQDQRGAEHVQGAVLNPESLGGKSLPQLLEMHSIF